METVFAKIDGLKATIDVPITGEKRY